MAYRWRRALPVIVALLVVGATATSCQPPAGLAVDVYLTGLRQPWDMTFAPDGTLLFTERGGTVNAYAGGQVRVLAQPTDVVVNWEAGMLGLAVDPAFATNRRAYTCFASNLSGVIDVRVARWTVDAGYTTLADRTDIVTGIPTQPGSFLIAHVGCRLAFGPDGYLWITTGDGAIPTGPQDPTSLAGKILRVDTDGDGAPGNPGPPLAPEVYSYGHRNPQGIAFQQFTGIPYAVEHGTDCDDEVNRIVAGGNYGWDPQQPGGGGPYTSAVPMTDLVRHPDAIPPVWASGCPTIAPSGAGFIEYRGDDRWAGWSQALAVAVLKGQQLRIMRLDQDGAFADDFVELTDRGRLRTALTGPDGNLYVLQDGNPAGILRVTPVL